MPWGCHWGFWRGGNEKDHERFDVCVIGQNQRRGRTETGGEMQVNSFKSFVLLERLAVFGRTNYQIWLSAYNSPTI